MAEENQRPKIRLAYLGMRRAGRHDDGWSYWADVVQDQESGEFALVDPNWRNQSSLHVRFYGPKVVKTIRAIIGYVYEFDTGDTVTQLSYPKRSIMQPIGKLSHEIRTNLYAVHRAEEAVIEARKALTKDRKLNLLHEMLEPARRAYLDTSYPARPQLLAQMIEYITRAEPIRVTK